MADGMIHVNGEPHNAESTVREAHGASQIGPFDYCPKLGFREYWYPGVRAREVRRAPVHLKMLGEDLVFFRDKAGKVVALSDWCPHRGARLSLGLCEFEGTPIPSSTLLVVLLVVLAWRGRIGPDLPFGVVALGPFALHPMSLLYLLSGSLMISKTLHIPKL